MSAENQNNIPVVSAIIERVRDDSVEILIQTRWKPDRDKEYSGTFEIPAGWVEKYENVYSALKREIFEETGLNVVKIYPDVRTKTYSPRDDAAFAFLPFCGQQQLKGGKPWIGFVFVCQVSAAEPVPQKDEDKDIKWIKKEELKKIFDDEPEKIFTLQLGTLDFYFNHDPRGGGR